MKIGQNSVVELIYELETDGQTVDRCTAEKPLGFIFGTGYLLPKFEENIAGLEPGSSFAFTLTPEEGYGVSDPERIIDLPKEAFIIEGQMRDDLMVVGNTIPLVNGMGGVVPGRIVEVGESTVRIDINHPMADKTLNFSGTIVSVREATDSELTDGLFGEKVRHSCHGCGHCHHDDGGNCGEGHCGEGHCGEGHCSEGHCNGEDGDCGHCHHEE